MVARPGSLFGHRWLPSGCHANQLALARLGNRRFSRNQPFDQFTIEQFAGDLLPNATPEQILATCFHRNHMTNGEGGRDPEESRVDYVIDRVNTIGATWLGMTLGCCQCHSHKFDPISQKDYYSLSAFFNSIDEDGKAGAGAKPFLSYASPHIQSAIDEAEALLKQRASAEKKARDASEVPFQAWLAQQFERTKQGWQAWIPLHASSLESVEGTSLHQDLEGIVYATGLNPNQDDYRIASSVRGHRITAIRLEVFPHPSHPYGGPSRGKSGEFLLTDVKLQVRKGGSSQVRDIAIATAVADYSADKKTNDNYGDIQDTLDDDPRNGWSTKGSHRTLPHVAVFALKEPLELDAREELVFEIRHRSTLGDANIGRFRLSYTSQNGEAIRSVAPSPIEALAEARYDAIEDIPDPLRERLFRQFLEDHPAYRAAKESFDLAKRQLDEIKKGAKANVMVLGERKEPRDSFVLVRGVWDKQGDRVEPSGLSTILPWRDDLPKTRLGLAQWLVSPDHPLTSRVVVNHVWQMLFGQGLVRTAEDFGLQGEPPVYQEILDWLAVDLVEHHWDVKRLIKLIVMSKTYQQDSRATPESLKEDPDNRWHARGARYRLPSWMIRDSALTVSGLLHPVLGGPPVRPYQPPGVWEEMFMGRFTYEPSDGPSQFRRSVYAFWRRAIAPTFLFDSAQRRVCEVRVSRTNTPLQALTLLNDETYLNAARQLGRLAIAPQSSVDQTVAMLCNRILGRPVKPAEQQLLIDEYHRFQRYYLEHSVDARKLLQTDRLENADDLSISQMAHQAAAMLIASMLLNSDEAMTHE